VGVANVYLQWLVGCTTTGRAASPSDDNDDILADLLSSGSEDDDQHVSNKPKLKLVSSRMQPATADKGMKNDCMFILYVGISQFLDSVLQTNGSKGYKRNDVVHQLVLTAKIF